MKIMYFLIASWSMINLAVAQVPLEVRTFTVKKITDKIEIDGQLDEAIWSELPANTNFIQYFPSDSVPAKTDTRFYMCYDDQNLYIGVWCGGAGDDWVVNSLKRDYRAGGNDNITFVLDTYSDKTNAFFFGINPEGVIREGVITNGGNSFRNFDESWDNKWRGEAKLYGDYYTAELEIPFAALRFTKGSESWNLGAYRFDTQDNEWSTWTGIPRVYPLMNLAYNGIMQWEEALDGGKSFAFIPYVTAGATKDYEENMPVDNNFAIGGDAKIAITSGLNLDLTFNPDFSQVEVDRQITDLSRFELFFPERRQFFLENADLFSSFGFGNMNPFFSRRIGVANNLNDERVQNKILGGARLSGKLSDRTRIGLLNMQTETDGSEGIAGANFLVAAIQQKVLERSNLSFIAVNKQYGTEQAQDLGLTTYNRIFGFDFNFANASNTWVGKTFIHASNTEGVSGLPISHGLELTRNTRNWEITWSHEMVQKDYEAHVGFVRRSDYHRINPSIAYRIFPSSGVFNTINVGGEANIWWIPGTGKTDHEFGLGMGGQFNNTARYEFGITHQYVYLFDSFDPTGTDSDELPEDTDYNYVNVQGFYRSDGRKSFNYMFRGYIGGYFNGIRRNVGGAITLRYQPKGSISIDYNYNEFDMPHLSEKKRTFLIGPRIDYTFSKELFFTTFIQYNTQSENTNINSRLQWRFAPVSDFFLVYTDNYFTGNDPSDRFSFDIKNRAIVMKLTYWINS